MGVFGLQTLVGRHRDLNPGPPACKSRVVAITLRGPPPKKFPLPKKQPKIFDFFQKMTEIARRPRCRGAPRGRPGQHLHRLLRPRGLHTGAPDRLRHHIGRDQPGDFLGGSSRVLSSSACTIPLPHGPFRGGEGRLDASFATWRWGMGGDGLQTWFDPSGGQTPALLLVKRVR